LYNNVFAGIVTTTVDDAEPVNFKVAAPLFTDLVAFDGAGKEKLEVFVIVPIADSLSSISSKLTFVLSPHVLAFSPVV
jgi:hypothetical protein